IRIMHLPMPVSLTPTSSFLITRLPPSAMLSRKRQRRRATPSAWILIWLKPTPHFGKMLFFDEIDLAGSLREYQRAVELKPNDATAHHWFGSDVLLGLGRFDEAIAECRRAVELDPLSPIINTDLGATLYLARRFDEANAQLRKTLEIDPTFVNAHYYLGLILQQKGDLPGAIAQLEKAKQLSGDEPFVSTLTAAAKAK